MAKVSPPPIPLPRPVSKVGEVVHALPPAKPPTTTGSAGKGRDRASPARRVEPLWLALHLPRLPLEIYTRAGGEQRCLAVCDTGGRRVRVLVANDRAQRRGVLPGTALGAAHALAEDLQILPRVPEREARALEGLAAWCLQFTSLVSIAAPDGLLLEIGGSLRLFGGARPLLRRVHEGLRGLGYRARLAAAPTPLAAQLLAIAGEGPRITAAAGLHAALSGLPLAALRCDDKTLESLHGMGLRSLGELLRMPRDGLSRRYGEDLLAMLDRALGQRPDPRLPYQPPPRFHALLSLPAETADNDALLFPARRLLDELAGVLRAAGGGAQRLDWTLSHAQTEDTRLALGLVAPSRDPTHLLGLLRERLDRLTLPAPVRELALDVEDILALESEHLDLFGDAPGHPQNDWNRLLERLRARLGGEAVTGLCLVPEHRPERAWRAAPAGKRVPEPPRSRRPLWLLEQPLRLRSVRGRPWLDGALALGEPERIESGWWDGQDIARDYYLASNAAGERYWIYRELREEQRWYLHGIFA